MRSIYRGNLTNLKADTQYNIAIYYETAASTQEFVDGFLMSSLPSDNLSLLIASNRLSISNSLNVNFKEGEISLKKKEREHVYSHLAVVIGEISYDYGMNGGYFLFDLFLKNFAEHSQLACHCPTANDAELVPFLVLPGKFDFSQEHLTFPKAEGLNLNRFFPQQFTLSASGNQQVTSTFRFNNQSVALVNTEIDHEEQDGGLLPEEGLSVIVHVGLEGALGDNYH